ncbi:MAG TPA: hypothetical protein PLS05_00725 [Clostridia bacterium]|nr:hypothetical protein [Clostridia bacterium]HOL60388.1 hypothetical protein [Clostridia bacterium]HPO53145.1 hypothetical protein [Clostridia bacterium]
MIPRYSFSMIGRNLDLIFKVLIYVFILSLLCAAILVSIISPLLKTLDTSFDFSERVLGMLSDLIGNGRPGALRQFFNELSSTLESISSEIAVAVVLIIIVVFAAKFFLSLTAMPLGEVVYGRMSQNFSVMFHNVLVSSLGKSLLYALIKAFVTIVADGIIIVVSYYLAKLLYIGLGVYGIALAAFVMFALLASRIAILGQWVPQIVCERKSVAAAFRDSFQYSAKYFTRVMPVAFLILVIDFSAVMLTTVVTFGILPAIIAPVSLVWITNLNLVAYFYFNKKKFYVDEVTVINQIENETDSGDE